MASGTSACRHAIKDCLTRERDNTFVSNLDEYLILRQGNGS